MQYPLNQVSVRHPCGCLDDEGVHFTDTNGNREELEIPEEMERAMALNKELVEIAAE